MQIAPLPENSLATGGCFECNTYRVKALGWLKKEKKERRRTILIFDHSRFATLKIVTTHCYYYCRLGQWRSSDAQAYIGVAN